MLMKVFLSVNVVIFVLEFAHVLFVAQFVILPINFCIKVNISKQKHQYRMLSIVAFTFLTSSLCDSFSKSTCLSCENVGW